MQERYQGGSLAGFIMIGAVLTLVLVGGLYGLNRYNAEQSTEVATSDKNEEKSKPSNDEGKKTPSTSESEPTGSSPEAPKEQPQTGVPADNSQPAAPSGGGEASENELPATGPSEALGAAIAVAALSFAGAAYAQSLAYTRK